MVMACAHGRAGLLTIVELPGEQIAEVSSWKTALLVSGGMKILRFLALAASDKSSTCKRRCFIPRPRSHFIIMTTMLDHNPPSCGHLKEITLKLASQANLKPAFEFSGFKLKFSPSAFESTTALRDSMSNISGSVGNFEFSPKLNVPRRVPWSGCRMSWSAC